MNKSKCPFLFLTEKNKAYKKVRIIKKIKNSFFLYRQFKKNKPVNLKTVNLCGPIQVLYDVIVRKHIQLRDIDIERMEKYGDIYLLFMGLTPIVVVTTAALTEEISKKNDVFFKSDPRDLNMPYFYKWVGNNNVVLSNGEQWERLRRIIIPTVNSVHYFTPAFVQKSGALIHSLDKIIQHNSSSANIYLRRWLKAVSLDTAGDSLFGYDFEHLKEKHNIGINAMDYVVKEIFNPIRRTFPGINGLPIESNKKLDESMKHLDNLVDIMIDYSESNKNWDDRKSNILQLLCDGNNDHKLDRRELRNNILAMILASHETTQVSLGGVLYHLAKHPELQEKLRMEVNKKFDNIDQEFTFMEQDYTNKKNQTLNKLLNFRTLENFILESLRIYSPLAHQNPRTTTCETVLGGYSLPKGTLISINIHAIHMNPKEWNAPETFDPDRFNTESIDTRYSYLPFGSPPRLCAGKKFSILEQKIIICRILKKYRIKLPFENYIVPIERTSFTGMHEDSFHLTFSKI